MKKRLLLVDDDPRKLELLRLQVAALGHEALLARGGVEALDVFARERPDLVLLDLLMPDLDGIDVLVHLRADPTMPYVPVIVVTALNDREARLRGLRAGADEFLEVPIDGAILEARVRTLLRVKSLTDELAERNAKLERLQADQRELTSFLVHDLKGPIGVLELVMSGVRESLTAEQAEQAEALLDGAESAAHLRRLVEQMLVLSRLEQPGFPIERSSVDPRGVLAAACASFSREASERGVELAMAFEGADEAWLDAPLVRRVLENLIDNALQHTATGGRVQLEARRGDGQFEFVVANTGAPIARGDRAKIFEKFVRGEGAPRGRGHAGLGLYFCRRAVESHGGAIALTESAAYPTRFVITLPAPRADGQGATT